MGWSNSPSFTFSVRCGIINERLNAGEIAEKLQITPAALSYHLKLLKNADLISEYKEKNFVYYEINTTVFDELIIWVNQFGGKKV